MTGMSAPTASALIEQAREHPYASPVRHGLLLEAIALALTDQTSSRKPASRKPPTSTPRTKATSDSLPRTKKAPSHA